MNGGTRNGWLTVHRSAVPPHRVPGFDQRDPRRFQHLVPPFATAFQAHMASLPCTRTARCRPRKSGSSSFSTYLKTYALQVVHGRLFGMGQSKANQWMHVLLPVLLAALRTLGDAPARSLSALAQRLGISEADAAAVVEAREVEPAPVAMPEAPLLPMTGPNGALSAPKTLLNRRSVIVGRKRTTPSKMSCSSMPSSSSSF